VAQMKSCNAQIIEPAHNLVGLIFIPEPLCLTRHFARNTGRHKVGKRRTPRRLEISETSFNFGKRGGSQSRYLMKRNPVF